jgi:hypothetical protein
VLALNQDVIRPDRLELLGLLRPPNHVDGLDSRPLSEGNRLATERGPGCGLQEVLPGLELEDVKDLRTRDEDAKLSDAESDRRTEIGLFEHAYHGPCGEGVHNQLRRALV